MPGFGLEIADCKQGYVLAIADCCQLFVIGLLVHRKQYFHWLRKCHTSNVERCEPCRILFLLGRTSRMWNVTTSAAGSCLPGTAVMCSVAYTVVKVVLAHHARQRVRSSARTPNAAAGAVTRARPVRRRVHGLAPTK